MALHDMPIDNGPLPRPLCTVDEVSLPWTLKISPDFLCKKQMKKPYLNLQIPLPLTLKCCINALSTNMVT